MYWMYVEVTARPMLITMASVMMKTLALVERWMIVIFAMARSSLLILSATLAQRDHRAVLQQKGIATVKVTPSACVVFVEDCHQRTGMIAMAIAPIPTAIRFVILPKSSGVVTARNATTMRSLTCTTLVRARNMILVMFAEELQRSPLRQESLALQVILIARVRMVNAIVKAACRWPVMTVTATA
jgi:hypothetical protein